MENKKVVFPDSVTVSFLLQSVKKICLSKEGQEFSKRYELIPFDLIGQNYESF